MDLISDPNFLLQIGGAILVTLIMIIIWYFRSSSAKKDTVLLLGSSLSGKTKMFYKLVDEDADPAIYTSFDVNEVVIEKKGNQRKITDFPGHDRLRRRLIDSILGRKDLRSVVFVIDSVTFGKNARDVAQFLYDVLLETGKKIPVLVACNKQDNAIAKTPKNVSETLEKELGLINKSRDAALTTTDGSSNRRTLTNTGVDFAWNDLTCPVEFVGCSIKNANSDEGFDVIKKFIWN